MDRSKFSAAIKGATKDIESFGGLVKKNSTQIKKMGRQMTVAGAAIVGGLGMMVKAYGSFDESMTRSLAIMGDVSTAMRDKMAKAAKQLSTETTFAAKDLAEAYFFLASAGMNAEQSISALGPVARFAQAGTFDLAQATDLLTDAQTALDLSTEDVVQNEKNLIRVSDVLVGANTLANASVLQFSESLTNKAAAALVNLNKEVEEGVAVLAAYADKGVKGRLAGNRLTMMLNGLFAATQENKKAWDKAGISLWETDGTMRSIADIIQDMEGYLGKMTVEQRTAELAVLGFNVRTKDSILTLMGSSEKIRGWTEDLKEMQGITKEVADKQLEAFNAKLTIAKNTVMLAAMGIGKSLAPMIVKLAKEIKDVAAKIATWIEKHPKLTAFIAKLALGVGTLLLVLGPLLIMLPGIAAGMMLLEKSATLMTIKVKVLTAAKAKWAVVNAKLGLSFKMLLGPIGLVIVAATTAGIIINKLIDNYKKKQDAEMNAMIRASKGHAQYWAFRKKMIADEVVTVEEWAEIYKKHGRDYRRVMIAISKLPEYAHIKAEWDAIIKKEKELAEGTRTNSEEVVSLISRMTDEIYKLTHNEFEVRTRMARKTYEERKAFLDMEKADDSAYAIAKKAYTTELNQIEEDRTDKLKAGWTERGRAVMAGLLAWYNKEKEARDKIKALHAGYTDIVKKLTLSDKDYRLWALDEWYAAELVKLGTNLEAKLALEKAYALQKEKIETETAKHIKLTSADVAMSVGHAFTALAGQNKALAIAGAIISTYAGAAKSLQLYGMPLAIPFIAMAILAGMKQVASIRAQSIPSYAEGGKIKEVGIVGEEGPELFVPRTPGTIIPLRREAVPISPPMTRMRIIIQNRITVGEQTFYKETVKSINKAGPLRDIIIPNAVVV